MKLKNWIWTMTILAVLASPTLAVTLTFDDIPEGQHFGYYAMTYGIHFDPNRLALVDHTGLTWGPPHSPTNVLVFTGAYPPTWSVLGFKKPFPAPPDLYASFVGGYFSTEPGVVLEMIGYHNSPDHPVASVLIGDPTQAWNNVYVHIDAPGQINVVGFRPVTTDALLHFCVDDITVNFVPEPASILALCAGLAPLLLRRRRWGGPVI